MGIVSSEQSLRPIELTSTNTGAHVLLAGTMELAANAFSRGTNVT